MESFPITDNKYECFQVKGQRLFEMVRGVVQNQVDEGATEWRWGSLFVSGKIKFAAHIKPFDWKGF